MAAKKRVPYMQTLYVSLGVNGAGEAQIQADSARTIHIEQFTQDTRVTATKALSDNEVRVNISDQVNASYTKGDVPVSHIAGKASAGFPKFLPMKLVIRQGAKLDFDFTDVSGVANTVALTAIGFEEVEG